MAITCFAVVEQAGQADVLRARLRSIGAHANEEPDGFRVTSPYILATLRRS